MFSGPYSFEVRGYGRTFFSVWNPEGIRVGITGKLPPAGSCIHRSKTPKFANRSSGWSINNEDPVRRSKPLCAMIKQDKKFDRDVCSLHEVVCVMADRSNLSKPKSV